MITAERMYVARPVSANGAAILVFQEAFGVNAYIRDIADRFADLGLLAVAPELYHRTAGRGFDAPYGSDEFRRHMTALTPEGLVEDAEFAFDFAAGEPGIDRKRIASVGFCMGGRVSYLANAALDLRAAISFYGGGIVPNLLDRANEQHGPLVMFWGGKDAHIPAEQHRSVSDALTAAGKTHEQVLFSDADHGFFCDQRASYNASASQQAWALTQAFLKVNGVL